MEQFAAQLGDCNKAAIAQQCQALLRRLKKRGMLRISRGDLRFMDVER
jgi:hypothetical protein